MKVKLLQTTGSGVFEEIEWDKPAHNSNEIEVKALMTGVCRSDLEMMLGNFGPLPLNMQGHEGLGVVIQVGESIDGVKIGDYVATRGEPAYADYYNCRANEFVVVPSADPKYILEPVACGINVVMQPLEAIKKRAGEHKRCLILGSGFLAQIVYKTLQLLDIKFETVDVVGNYNRELWGDTLQSEPVGSYDVVVDLSSRIDVLDAIEYTNEALLVLGVQKQLTSDYGNLLWKACTIVFPSPRAECFIDAMVCAEKWITNNSLVVDNFWTRAYNRSMEWQQAFNDGLNRPNGYSRGYIKWD
jgi:D-arabinose 1-dehydrogenase-like Zn-dependent alcohol dehydrogenase